MKKTPALMSYVCLGNKKKKTSSCRLFQRTGKNMYQKDISFIASLALRNERNENPATGTWPCLKQ